MKWERYLKYSIRKLSIGAASVLIGLGSAVTPLQQAYASEAQDFNKNQYIIDTAADLKQQVINLQSYTDLFSSQVRINQFNQYVQKLQAKLDAYSQRQSVWYKPADWERYEQKVIEATTLLEQAQPIYDVLPSMASKSSENLAKAQAIFARKNQWGIIFREDHETIEQAIDRTYQDLKVAYEEMLPLTNDITPIASVYQRLMPSFEQQNPLYKMLNDLTSLENYIESTATTARREHEELSKGFAENHKILVSNLNGRLSEDDEKALLEALTFDYTVPFDDTETAVFVNYDGVYKIRFNHDGTLTVLYTTDGSEDTVPLSLFARQDTNAQPSYTISYRYEHAPEGLVPPVAVSKKIGEVIDFPQDGEVITRSEGTYRLSWDKSVNRVPSSNYEVVGIWEFIPITRYDVIYEFRSTDGSQLPEVVQKLKPIDQIGVVQGTQVTPPETFQDQLEARGLWRFEGWDKTSQLVQDSPLRFIGTWEFVKNHELLAAIAELETEVILSNRILTTQNYQQASNRLAYDQSLAKARAILANSQSDLTAIREALTSLSTVKNSLDGDQRIATSKVEAAESAAQAAQAKLAEVSSDALVTPADKSAVDEAIAEARTALSEARRAVDSLPSGSAKTVLEGRLGAVSLPASPAITDSNSNGRLDSEEAAEAKAKAIAEATRKVEAAESAAQAAKAKLAEVSSDALVTPADKSAVDEAIAEARTALSEARRAVDSLPSGSAKTALEGRLGAVSLPASPAITDSNSNGRLDSEEAAEAKAKAIAEATRKVEAAESAAQAAKAKLAEVSSDALVTPADKSAVDEAIAEARTALSEARRAVDSLPSGSAKTVLEGRLGAVSLPASPAITDSNSNGRLDSEEAAEAKAKAIAEATRKVEAAESAAQAAKAKLAEVSSDALVTPADKSAVDEAIAEARTALSEARRAVDSLPSGSAKTALEGRLGAVSLPASPAITDSNSNGRLDSEEAAEAKAKAIAEATRKVEAAESAAQAAKAKLAEVSSDALVTPADKSAVDEAIAEARTALSEARRAVDSLPSGSAKTALEGRLGAVSLPASPAITDSNSNGRLDSEEAAEAKAKAIAEATRKVEAAESAAQAAKAKLADATSDQLVTPAEKTDNVSMRVDKTVFPSIQQSVYRSNLDIESRLSSTSQPSTSSIPSLTVTQTEPESLKSADSSEDILSSKPSVQPSSETVQQIDSNTLPLIIALGGTIFLISGLAIVIIKRKKHDD